LPRQPLLAGLHPPEVELLVRQLLRPPLLHPPRQQAVSQKELLLKISVLLLVQLMIFRRPRSQLSDSQVTGSPCSSAGT
jgi:hypothetical protein